MPSADKRFVMSRYYAFWVQRLLFGLIAFSKQGRLCNLAVYEMALFLLSRIFRSASRSCPCFGIDVSDYQYDYHAAWKALWNCGFHRSCGGYLSACNKFWDISLDSLKSASISMVYHECFSNALCLQPVSNHPI